jgi:hypothetical protein
MPFTIVTPTEIKQPLYEGPMELTWTKHRGRGEPETFKAPGPVATLGRPVWWNLATVASEEGIRLPPATEMLLWTADFYLLQLVCSFRNKPHWAIEWGEFAVKLEPETGEEMPVAFDLFPQEVAKESEVGIQVSITPGLRFSERPKPIDYVPPEQFNIPAIRALIRAAFDYRELKRFCMDRPLFSPIVNLFGPGFAFEDMIDACLEYCQRRVLFPELLSAIETSNPRQYQRFADRLYGPAAPSLGTALITIDFRNPRPLTYGFGAMQSDPSWRFEMHEKHPVRGDRFGYIVVQKPHSAGAVRLTLDVSAGVQTGDDLASGRIREGDRGQLTVLVCTD